MKKTILSAVIFGLLGAAGCASVVTVTPLNPSPRPAAKASAAGVELYASAPPARSHRDVSVIEVEQNGLGDAASLIDDLRSEAAAQGCDALVLAPPSWRGGGHSHRVLSGTCIVYTDDPAAR